MLSHQPSDFLPVGGSFEVNEGFVRVHAYAVGEEAVMHDLQESLRVRLFGGDEEEVVGLSH